MVVAGGGGGEWGREGKELREVMREKETKGKGEREGKGKEGGVEVR